jgi:hypothetical protein
MKTQISIEKLERILNAAKEAIKYNSSLSDTIEIVVLQPSDTHCGSDRISVELKSSYSECIGHLIFEN